MVQGYPLPIDSTREIVKKLRKRYSQRNSTQINGKSAAIQKLFASVNKCLCTVFNFVESLRQIPSALFRSSRTPPKTSFRRTTNAPDCTLGELRTPSASSPLP